MASIVVRGLDDSVKEELTKQAMAHGRSLEAEICDILTEAVRKPQIGLALMRLHRTQEGSTISGFPSALTSRERWTLSDHP